MTKLRFSVIVTFSIILTLGYLAVHTENPAALTLPILVITGGSLYASRSLFDQARKVLKQLKGWTKHPELGLSSSRPLVDYTKRRRGRRIRR